MFSAFLGNQFSPFSFAITLNDQGEPVLMVVGDESVRVKYCNNASNKQPKTLHEQSKYQNETFKRYQSSWSLFPETCSFEVKIGGKLEFELRWPKLSSRALQHRILELFRAKQQLSATPISPTPMPDYQLILNEAKTSYNSVYIPFQELGKGGQATVFRALQVSTGRVYACKYFNEGCTNSIAARKGSRREVGLLKQCRGHVSLEGLADNVTQLIMNRTTS